MILCILINTVEFLQHTHKYNLVACILITVYLPFLIKDVKTPVAFIISSFFGLFLNYLICFLAFIDAIGSSKVETFYKIFMPSISLIFILISIILVYIFYKNKKEENNISYKDSGILLNSIMDILKNCLMLVPLTISMLNQIVKAKPNDNFTLYYSIFVPFIIIYIVLAYELSCLNRELK